MTSARKTTVSIGAVDRISLRRVVKEIIDEEWRRYESWPKFKGRIANRVFRISEIQEGLKLLRSVNKEKR